MPLSQSRWQAQNDLDKEVIKLDDRINAMYLVQSGGLITIFPDPECGEPQMEICF